MSTFHIFVALHLATAVLCCTVAALSIRAMLRAPSWRPLPGWSFIAFVSVDGLLAVLRAGLPILPRWQGWMLIGTTMDVIAAGLLALVFIHATRRSRVALLVVEEARRSAAEYDRARHEYEQLMRHRIANPLAVVHGVAHTLDAHPELPAPTRAELVRSLLASTNDLLDVSLDPRQRSPEEHELHAVPRLAPTASTATTGAAAEAQPRSAYAIA